MNIKYLGYNLVRTNYKKLFGFIRQYVRKYDKTTFFVIKDILYCFNKHDTRFIDYFYLRFFNPTEDRDKHTNYGICINFIKSLIVKIQLY